MATRNWAVLRKFLRTSEGGHNREVYRHFKDVSDTEDTSRKKLRDYCLIQANDSITDAKLKILIFDRYAQRSHLKPNIYGIPVETHQESVDFHPQVCLFFAQDSAAVPEGKPTIQAELQFRIINETPTTLTETNARTIATKIANEFVPASTGFVFTKGKNIAIYRDIELKYNLQVYVSSETEGEQVIRKILNVQNHTYNPDKFKLQVPKRNSVNNPVGTTTIYGKPIPNRRWRPTGNVRFRYAILQLCGYRRDIALVDTTGYHRDALVKRF